MHLANSYGMLDSAIEYIYLLITFFFSSLISGTIYFMYSTYNPSFVYRLWIPSFHLIIIVVECINFLRSIYEFLLTKLQKE